MCRPTAPASAVLTVEELSKLFKVSTKTISRWRQQGLVSRRFVFDGRKRVGFLEELGRSVRRRQRGARAPRRAVQPADATKSETRSSSAPGGWRGPAAARRKSPAAWPSEWAAAWKPFATRSSSSTRSIPTWRFSRTARGPLTDDDKKKIYQQYRRGASVEALAKRYCRTKTSIYRVINEMRARRIMELPLDYIPNPHVRASQRRERRSWADMPAADMPAEEDAAAGGSAAVPGQPVRSAAVDARAGSAPVPQVQLS